jgi:hypothetical protein
MQFLTAEMEDYARLWKDDSFRRERIRQLAMHKAILLQCLKMAEVNELPESTGNEVALIMAFEENTRLEEQLRDALLRAMPARIIG